VPRSHGLGYTHGVEVQQSVKLLSPRPASALDRRVKRAFDLTVALTGLVTTAPLLIGAAALIRLTGGAPVLFAQERVGLRGRRFRLLKLRTMIPAAEAQRSGLASRNELAGPPFKIRDDPRITPVGRLLRRFSIDELPQLVNVLKGEMSIVGPRPPTPDEVALYQPWQLRRLAVTPGLTCTWQISGRSLVDFDDWVRLDLEYIDRWSLARDFAIILRTVPAVLSGRGAW
jgi:lipopolysaccharide/colanic/teichoic acid biosynthesis glycosyltransferase